MKKVTTTFYVGSDEDMDSVLRTIINDGCLKDISEEQELLDEHDERLIKEVVGILAAERFPGTWEALQAIIKAKTKGSLTRDEIGTITELLYDSIEIID